MVKSDEELSPELYKVARRGLTEAPFSGKYCASHEEGVYKCAICGAELFSSDAKFDSGTGWPSFTEPINLENIELREDRSLDINRIEVLCKRCGAHLGHVFDDGPKEKGGKRYCINSVCLELAKKGGKYEKYEKRANTRDRLNNIILVWVKKYERYLSQLVFFAGFMWDSLTLTRVDLLYDNIIFIFYLLVAGAGILFVNSYRTGKIRLWFLEPYAEFISFPVQFAFGGLFSGFFIFYSRSGTVAGSWPFLLFLAVILVGNEFFRKRYLRLTFQTSVYFLAIFSYAVFILPVVLGKMGPQIFLLSGAASIFLIAAFILLVSRISRTAFAESRKDVFGSVAAIYLLLNLLYFASLIPPIPLSLKEIGVYHSVRRAGDLYELKFEPAPWYVFWREESRIFHRAPGEPVYVYSAVFSPTRLNVSIFHRWSYYDAERGRWISTDRISYPIFGGRDGGYRGFTLKGNLTPGLWRVDVETGRGELLGRVKFEVVEASEPSKLETAVR